ncbi:AVID protein, partial [Indicator maculatus]|nr:AVID protein [Indicator maculatus]
HVPVPATLPAARLCCGIHTESLPLQCVLTGNWTNDLHSNMTIGAVNEEGSFNGKYHTSVSDSPDKIQLSPLQGSEQHRGSSGQPVFGFTVNWTFADTVSVFTGQCFVVENGKEVLKTMWLLRSHVDNITDDWKATR